jgi:hypothetical protein
MAVLAGTSRRCVRSSAAYHLLKQAEDLRQNARSGTCQAKVNSKDESQANSEGTEGKRGESMDSRIGKSALGLDTPHR